jgi:hypothetical protein
MKFLSKLLLLAGISIFTLPCLPGYNKVCSQPWNDIRGTWYFQGYRCYIDGDGRSFVVINEQGDRASAYLVGNRIVVPQWGMGAVITDNAIYWDNRSVWTR